MLLACAALTSSPRGATEQPPSPAVRQAQEAAYRENNLGVAYLEQYDFESATAAFARALGRDPTLGLARVNHGIALFYAGKPDAAIAELEKARALVRDRPHADYVLGLILRATDRADEALAAFQRVREADAGDPGTAINIGQILLQQRKYPEALEAFRTATAAEPYNATAAYGLATALLRSGAADEGKTAMAHFERLRESSYATTFSQTYLEQGRYAEAIASTGAEAALVDSRVPDVEFVDATRAVATGGTPDSPAASGPAGAVMLIDLDRDGDLDLADAGASGLRLYRNDKAQLTDITTSAFITPPAGGVAGIIAADADNDGDVDLLALGAAGPVLFIQEPAGRFTRKEAGLPAWGNAPRTAAWLDADHDGDADLVVAGADGDKPIVQLLRNSGDGTFTDVTAAAKLTAPRIVTALVPTDFDNRRDIDILMVTAGGVPLLYRNLRDGSFADVAADVGVTASGTFAAATLGDVNKDGYPDAFVGQPAGAGQFIVSDGRGRYATTAAPPATAGAIAAQFVDYDNDGLLDLLTITPQGLRVQRNLGTSWQEASMRAAKATASLKAGDAALMTTGDIDGDGDVDVVVRGRSGLSIWRNDGGSRRASLRLHLKARVTNRAAVGTKIDMRAGSLRQRIETSAATPAAAPADIVFGLGDRPGADVARVLWPSGILQAETASGEAGGKPAFLVGSIEVEELDRKPSSCPYLYTWNGERFEFITDFLGGGEMGYWQAPGVRNTPDPDEYIRIEGRHLAARDGRFELRVTNELEEALFLDRAELVAIAHPAGVEVHPNEGLRSTREPFVLHAIRNLQPPAAVHDDHGHDVRERILENDRRSPDDFHLERIRGYAGRHALTITLPRGANASRALLLTGWTDYAFSGDNVAAHQLGLQMLPPSLEVEDANGQWKTAIAEIGFPVGRPQTIVVDLRRHVPADARRVRVVTSMRIYWDRIQVGDIDPSIDSKVTRLDSAASTLRWRGFSAIDTPDGREPYGFRYDEVSALSPWKLLPGRYTREGDVNELLARADDRFVVSRPGDEIALAFDASRVPPAPPGWTYTFLLHAVGYSKEMDLNSASPDELGPLPFAGMPAYPYDPSAAPAHFRGEAHRRYLDRFNTRIVRSAIPPIELSHARTDKP